MWYICATFVVITHVYLEFCSHTEAFYKLT